MIFETLVVGPFQCNCSILACEKTKEAVLIDAGDEGPRIASRLKQLGVTVKYSLHTHAHLDHIGAVKDVKGAAPGAKVCLHRDDHEIYRMLPQQGRMFGFQYDEPPPVDRFLEDGEEVVFGDGVSMTALHTPGHSPGGLCFRFKEGQLGEKPFLFSGDTLFFESIGRTDLWGGDFGVLSKSIKERLYSLDEETDVLPGHGPRTSIAHEKRENPFVSP